MYIVYIEILNFGMFAEEPLFDEFRTTRYRSKTTKTPATRRYRKNGFLGKLLPFFYGFRVASAKNIDSMTIFF